MHHTVYKITNIINGMIYIGVHSTNNLDDGYMGSGVEIKKDIKKYGVSNFKKEFLYIFDDIDDMMNMEAKIVNHDFIKRSDTYNVVIGGYNYFAYGMVPVRDSNDNILYISKTDERYLSGELKHHSYGSTTLKNLKTGEVVSVSKNDPRYLSDDYVGVTKGFVTAYDKDGNTHYVSKNDSRYLSGELKHTAHGYITVVDKDGNYIKVKTDDQRYLSGELKHNITGRKNINNGKINKMVYAYDVDEYLENGWMLGKLINVSVIDKNNNIHRVLSSDSKIKSGEYKVITKIWVNNTLKNKRILKTSKDEYITNGWKLGRFLL